MISAKFEKRLPGFTLRVDIGVENITAILRGESGSGKTTILDCIAGLASPDSGTIILDGTTVYSSAEGINLPPRKRRVGYVFQDYALFPHLSAQENVALALTSSRKASAREYLRRLGIEHLHSRKPTSFSGGERQRLALARALATEPGVLLLDEPFSALDDRSRELAYGEFISLRDSLAMSVILVTHSWQEASELGHATVELHDGRTHSRAPENGRIFCGRPITLPKLDGVSTGRLPLIR